jgi:GTP-binding protein HflX
MARYHQTEQKETCVLVALETGDSPDSLEARLDELEELAATAGADTLAKIGQKRRQKDPAYLIGHGKADELAAEVAALQPSVVIFDDELSPTQQRNLGETLKARVIDRTQLILDIFAQRAHTREGKLQVELAQLSYLLPRLARSTPSSSGSRAVSGCVAGAVRPSWSWTAEKCESVSSSFKKSWKKSENLVGSSEARAASCRFPVRRW